MTVVAGEFVEVQVRVNFVVDLVCWRLVTRGAAVTKLIISLIYYYFIIIYAATDVRPVN